MRLKTVSEFLSENIVTGCTVEQIHKLRNYAEFLKQPLKLEMFLPCDKEGKASRPNPVELAKGVFNYTKQNIWDEKNPESFDKILFEGNWKHSEDDRYIGMNWVNNGTITIPMHSVKTIEDLCSHNVCLKNGWEEKIKYLQNSLK